MEQSEKPQAIGEHLKGSWQPHKSNKRYSRPAKLARSLTQKTRERHLRRTLLGSKQAPKTGLKDNPYKKSGI